MEQQTRDKPQPRKHVDTPVAIAAVEEVQLQTDGGLDTQRPPEVDAARERELQETAKTALLNAAHHQERNAPQCGKPEDLHAAQRNRPKVQPSTPSQTADEQGERHKARQEALEEAQRGARADEVVGQQVAAPPLDQSDDGRRTGHAHQLCQLFQGLRTSVEMFPQIDEAEAQKDGSGQSADEEEQREGQHHRPARAQPLRPHENFQQDARLPGLFRGLCELRRPDVFRLALRRRRIRPLRLNPRVVRDGGWHETSSNKCGFPLRRFYKGQLVNGKGLGNASSQKDLGQSLAPCQIPRISTACSESWYTTM